MTVEPQVSSQISASRTQEVDQTVVNQLASAHGLEPTTLEVGSDRYVRVCLLKNAGGEKYLQAYVSFRQGVSSDISAHVGLYGPERRLVDKGWLKYGDIDAAFDGITRRFAAVLTEHAGSKNN